MNIFTFYYLLKIYMKRLKTLIVALKDKFTQQKRDLPFKFIILSHEVSIAQCKLSVLCRLVFFIFV